MKQFLTLVLFLVWSTPGYPQKSPVTFGDIPMEDMKMTSYEKDSSAAAVILVDYGEAQMAAGWSSSYLYFKKLVRIKILKKNGLSWANVTVPLYHQGSKTETISDLKGTTYNLEQGRIVATAMSKENIFKEKFNKGYTIQEFTLPGVKEGSVIEYTYTIRAPSQSFPNWQFQKSVPVRLSEYWALIPKYYVYEEYLQGYLPLTVDEDIKQPNNVNAHHWMVKDVPAFKPEPFITCEDDYVLKINLQNAGLTFSWGWMSVLLEDEQAIGNVSSSGYLKYKAEKLTEGITDTLQKIEAVDTYVRQNIEWNGVKDFYAGNLGEVMEQKKGTSGDINLLLALLLRKAGIHVDLVLLSTRDHGLVRGKFPALSQFNYIICLVKSGSKTLLLDATEKYLPLTLLPERCLNGQGLIISGKENTWIDLTSKTKSRTIVGADFKLDEKGELNGKLSFTRGGYDAFDMRKEYHSKGEKEYVKDLLANRSWQMEKAEFSDVQELDKPVKEVYDITIAEHASTNGSIIYINPFVDSQEAENPFKSEKRDYPVDFGILSEKIYFSKMALPDGFSIDELPASKIIALPDNAARFSYNAVQVGNIISVTSSLQINKSLFQSSEYANLREFYSRVVAKQSEQIVLKRK